MRAKTLKKSVEALKGWGDVATGKTYFAQNQCDPFGHS